MKIVTFTEFRAQASSLISAVENGEQIIIRRHGKPVARISSCQAEDATEPAWRRPGLKLAIKGADLSKAILEEREAP